ncbi:transcriptional regulator GcvA [Marinimicrococcus flavescens]|uniref:Transcriptional regulator GcvA n=1 Tax=Marinimicrococcus flavescens TaxID=3031815 RepID=A0AAP3UZB7_9PROT|nr:transcriptional regulator GcvA [Marinimicrococcus flavescens]
MIRPLPTMAALRAFRAAAREASFTRAAVGLGQTQGAISHQIRELEARLGVLLFERGPRGLALTGEGRSYLAFVEEALDRLEAGEAAVSRRQRPSVLNVSISPNFATKWLVPRLGAFLEAQPEIDLRISASTRHVDFRVSDIDLAVRHGDGNWPELAVRRLCEEEVFPVASPALLKAGIALKEPADLARFPLLHDRDRRFWHDWLETFGAAAENAAHGPVFSQTSLAIDAAVSSQGIALARSALAALDLIAGRLLRPLPHARPAAFAYWIVCPPRTARLPRIRLFRDWLLAQAAQDAARLGGP